MIRWLLVSSEEIDSCLLVELCFHCLSSWFGPLLERTPSQIRLITTGTGSPFRKYDPVAYFTDSKPVKGDSKFSYSWHGGVWQFASAQHRDLFVNNPDQYAPQYGGYCAYSVGENRTVDIDPEAWKIIEGKLYLNYSKDVQSKFVKEAETLDTKHPAMNGVRISF